MANRIGFGSREARDAAHGGNAAAVAVGQLLQRRALRTPSGSLCLLCRCQGRGSAHRLSTGFGAAPAFGGASADQIAFDIGLAPENRQHQAPGAGAGVGPRLRE
jgi:hypothetical protein